ncbi:TPA: glycosyltransferase family 25 protein [Klebsiella pneumoniae]|uniref:glycosyltransferase family 25 protein n=1 Tax=Klebsiella pneumoniae TaxID=573 RepID=UPI000DC7DB27|nr:glycosyltransferase family 25 protein [Klebsiella pneumoniae]AWX83275.1 glycosyltransferase [Klebsiella pneumoniae subsp. pneumoniae]HBS0498662.1 glycosyltransferase family 25 protein [Klebsiella pneumoniae]HBV5832647.1 glycosyltransferase family 25 protein [Klebsiella pneumoniae]HBW9534687.1 glycosyltransferase [Klebsiella pneumoniae]HDK5278828.1 glycosyltransferase family 25 protein [Klebsiella pneumoniae]
MIPVFVISMQSDYDRRKIISDKMNKYNIHYEFIDAVVGKDLPQSKIENIDLSCAIARKNRHVSLGEIGCTLSHIKVYEKIIDDNIPYCLILEDDAIFDHRLYDFLKSFTDSVRLKNENDLLILGGQNGIDKNKFISRSIWSKLRIGEETFYKTIRSEMYIFRTCCYVVTLDIARNLYAFSQKEFFIADEWSYFKSKGLINSIYLSDFVEHPLDLSNSHIEMERLNSIKNYSDTKSDNVSDSFLKYFLKKYLFATTLKKWYLKSRTLFRCFLP